MSLDELDWDGADKMLWVPVSDVEVSEPPTSPPAPNPPTPSSPTTPAAGAPVLPQGSPRSKGAPVPAKSTESGTGGEDLYAPEPHLAERRSEHRQRRVRLLLDDNDDEVRRDLEEIAKRVSIGFVEPHSTAGFFDNAARKVLDPTNRATKRIWKGLYGTRSVSFRWSIGVWVATLTIVALWAVATVACVVVLPVAALGRAFVLSQRGTRKRRWGTSRRPPRPTGGGPRDGETTLYRFFDAHEDLLYVGITNNWQMRLGQHRTDKPWFVDVARAALETHPSRQDALDAEERVIKKERPVYNVVHNQNNRKRVRWK